MISGTVNSRYEIVISFSIRDSAGQEHPVEAILDTGYNASLSRPAVVIAALGLTWKSNTTGILADGSLKQFDNYSATIIWDGKQSTILVQAIENVPMLGLPLMIGHDLRARFAINGRVEIEAIP
jgi:predicted aspartyl protease